MPKKKNTKYGIDGLVIENTQLCHSFDYLKALTAENSFPSSHKFVMNQHIYQMLN